MLAILCTSQDKHGEGEPKKLLTNDKSPSPTAPPSALPPKPSQYSEPPTRCLVIQQAMAGRGQVYVPLQVSDIRGI
jgi:hypothetical protein